jgi:primosomal protein N' (replication factor Y)
VQSLVRWDAAWFAERELADRTSAGLPPASRMAILRGGPAATAEVLAMLRLPHRALGPVDDRTIVVVEREHAGQLSRRLRAISATRAAQRSGEPVTVMLDPREP